MLLTDPQVALDQGRAAALAAFGLKTAASRLDKEIAAGRLSYTDVFPKYFPTHLSPEEQKVEARKAFHAPSKADPAQLERLQQRREHTYRAQSLRPDTVIGAPAAQETRVLPRALSQAPSTQSYALPEGGMRYDVAAGPRSGQYLRSAVEMGDAADSALRNPKRLLPAAPEDRSLNLGMLQHELGEVEDMRSPVYNPIGSHQGTTPLVREQMAVHGDPKAYRALQDLRMSDPDDALAQKLMRQVGARPDSPIPIGGKQHRALDRALGRNVGKLAPETRRGAINAALDDTSRAAAFGRAPSRVGYLPPELTEKIQQSAAAAAQKYQNPRAGAVGFTTVRRNLPKMTPDLRAMLQKFIAKGRL